MLPCINEATTMNADFATDMRAYAEAGFSFVEFWPSKVDTLVGQGKSLEEIRSLVDSLGLRAVAGCAQGGLLLSEGEKREKALAELRHNFEICQAMGAETFIVFSENADRADERVYPIVSRNLREVSELGAEYGVSIALEFIRGSNLVGTLLTAQSICQSLALPNLGVLLDTFHFYAGISKTEDLQLLDVASLAFVHINDAKDKPRETWTDADRVLLGDGALPVREMLATIKAKGYTGYLSLELFNREFWAQDPFAVARRAYRNVTEFLASLS